MKGKPTGTKDGLIKNPGGPEGSGKATYDKSRLSVVGKASVMLCPAVEAVGAGVYVSSHPT